MTTVQITLPDALAKEAAKAGLLAPERIADILREQLRAERIERLSVARERLASNPIPPITAEEIQAEIDAYRVEQRRADRPLTAARAEPARAAAETPYRGRRSPPR